MALKPYTVIEPTGTLSPLVVDSPHSGRIYPVDFAYACPLPLLRQAEDAYIDEVVAGAAEAGAAVVLAEFPRSMIDVNRAESDLDPAAIDGDWPEALAPDAMTLSGFGLVRRLCRNGVNLYRQPLSAAEIKRRIDRYYRPYHTCLQEQLTTRQARFGTCYLINAHSMPDRIDNGLPRADFILGDRDGTSCAPEFTQYTQTVRQNMGYHVTLNTPYKGREIVKRYGLTGHGFHALQIEINRKLYIDEITVEKHAGFASLRHNMARLFHALAQFASEEATDRQAAE